MSDNIETGPPDNMMKITHCKQPPVIQTDSVNEDDEEKEELIENNSPRPTGQKFSANALKKITFPISPFRKKFKQRTELNCNILNASFVRTNLVKDQNGLKRISIHENSALFKDLGELKRKNEIVPIEITDRTASKSTEKQLIRLNTNAPAAVTSPAVMNTFVDIAGNSSVDVDSEQRISYRNHLDLNKTKSVELVSPGNMQKTEKNLSQFETVNKTLTNRLSHNSMIDTGKLVNHLSLTTSAKHNSSGVMNSPDNERTLRTDLLNLTIMNKKKKLVDRIKMSIVNNGKPIAKENVDLSIVKKELPDCGTSDSDELDATTKESYPPTALIEQVTIKMEPNSNLVLEDNLPNAMPTVGHFMALPALRQSVKSKTLAASEVALDSDCVVVHKLVCLICKKTEMVSVKKSCIRGNIFVCKACSKLFDQGGEELNESALNTTEYNILDITCIRCNLTFSNASEVELHNKEVHKDELPEERGDASHKSKRQIKPQYCNDCDKTFKETEALCKHIKSRRHKCEYCHKMFSTNSDLKKHVNIHTNEKTYVCIYCGKSFNSRGNMVKHLETHKERTRSFKCEFCDKTFLKSDHLKVHVNTHTNEKLYECPYCKKTFNRKYCLQLHVNIHTLEKIYECHFCNKICMDPSTLRKHISTHSDQRPFKCEMCDKTFKQKPHLSAHMKMHDIKQTFSCSYCDKVFFSKNTLRVHINTHTHEKTFCCIYCQKTFTSKSNLLTHVNNKHTVDRTYNCSYCSKVFTDPSTVKKHENIHTNELTYQCAYCDKVFLRKTHLRSHINMHIKYKPYKCKLCDKSFAIKGYLKVHNNIHKGVKPFKCKRCGKAFTSKSNLILHTNSHTKERMFQCSYCHKDFTQKANLKSHIIRSHMDTAISLI